MRSIGMPFGIWLSSCAAALGFAACGGVAGHGKYEIRATLVDAETGASVSRQRMYVEAFDDSSEERVSLVNMQQSSFTLRMPGPDVHLRVRDAADEFHPYEAPIAVPSKGMDLVVRLVPTHFVLLKARLLVKEGDRWVRMPPEPHTGVPEEPGPPGESMLMSFWLGNESCGNGDVYINSDATFEVRLPRDRLRIEILDSPYHAESRVLDLAGVTAAVIERDIHLVD